MRLFPSIYHKFTPVISRSVSTSRVVVDSNAIRKPELQTGPDTDTLAKSKVHPPLLKPSLDPIFGQEGIFDSLKDEVTIEKLFAARVHFGHKMGTLKDNMKWALYGERLDVCIFDLDITRKYLIKAMEFIAGVSYCDGRFLFVTSNKAAILMVEAIATEIGEFSHTRRWEPGTLLNSKRRFTMPVRLPDTMIFLNTLSSANERHQGIDEAAKMCIPTVGIVDSNSVPNLITYPVPGNDDSIQSIELYMDLFKKAILFGRQLREEMGEGKKQQRDVGKSSQVPPGSRREARPQRRRAAQMRKHEQSPPP